MRLLLPLLYLLLALAAHAQSGTFCLSGRISAVNLAPGIQGPAPFSAGDSWSFTLGGSLQSNVNGVKLYVGGGSFSAGSANYPISSGSVTTDSQDTVIAAGGGGLASSGNFFFRPIRININTANATPFSGIFESGPSPAGSFNGTLTRTTCSAPPLSISSSTLPDGDAGLPYSTTLVATGGSGSGYSWSLPSGTTLPTGFTLSPAGVLSSTGAPAATPALYLFDVQVSDSAGASVRKTISVTLEGLILTITRGNNQQAGITKELPTLLEVALRTKSGAAPNGVNVNFTFSSQPSGASGTSFSQQQLSTLAGQAWTLATLGNKPGAYSIQASCGGCTPVTFQATALLVQSMQLISRPLDMSQPDDPLQLQARMGRHTYFLVTDFLGNNSTYAGFESPTRFLQGEKNNRFDLYANRPNVGDGCNGSTRLHAICQTITPPSGKSLDDLAKSLEDEVPSYAPEGQYRIYDNNCNVWALRRINRLGINIALPSGAVTTWLEANLYAPSVVAEIVTLTPSLGLAVVTNMVYSFYGIQ